LYQLPDEALGKQVRCPYCKKVAIIPAPVSRTTAGPTLSTAVQPPAAPPPRPVRSPAAPVSPAPAPKTIKLPLPVPVLLAAAGAFGLLMIVLTIILIVAVFRGGGKDKEEVVQTPNQPVPGDQKAAEPNVKNQPVVEKPDRPADDRKEEPADRHQVEVKPNANGDEDGPPLLFQIHSLDRFFADLRIIGQAIKKSAEVEQAIQALQAPFGAEGVPGIDPRKPWGAYARLNANAPPSWPVILIPIRDEAGFLRLLNALQCSTTKNADGVYEVKHAQVSKRMGFRFANRHAYVAIDDFDGIKEENLVEPSKVFVRDDAADARLSFRVDRLPKELRMRALAGLQQAGPILPTMLPPAPPNVRAGQEKLLDLMVRYATVFVEDSRELSLSVRLDPTRQEFAADLRFSPVENSPLARSLASIAQTPSLFGELSAGSPAFRGRIHVRLPEELRQVLAPLSHAGLEQALQEQKDREKDPENERFVRAFEATVAAGEIDVALLMNSQGLGRPVRVVGGLKVVNGLEIEKAFRGLVGTLPPAERGLFQFDVAKAAGTTIHRLSMQGKLPELALTAFGDPFFYYAFREDTVLFAAGDNPPESINQVLTSGPRRTPPALLEMNVKHLVDALPESIAGGALATRVFTEAHPGLVRLSLGEGSLLHLRLDLTILQALAEKGLLQVVPQNAK
jgi:hypothetical protein